MLGLSVKIVFPVIAKSVPGHFSWEQDAALSAHNQPRLSPQLPLIMQPKRWRRYSDKLGNFRWRHAPQDCAPNDLAPCWRGRVATAALWRPSLIARKIVPCEGVHTNAQGPCDSRPGSPGRLQFIRNQHLLWRRNVARPAPALTGRLWQCLE